ncbi:ATP-binding protein, partial [Plasticicumulans sp.]|uniref:ATP-binding protein n=1 Tax=Plasticicumulans sp. TaxID=2307179 RepID=UPI0032201B5A
AGRLQLLRDQRDAALAGLGAREREDETGRAQALAVLLAERDRALQAGGVDTEALRALDAELRELQQRLQLAREAQGKVREWQRWHDEDWPKRAQAAAAETEADAKLATLRAQLDAQARRWRERLAAFEAQAAALAARQAELDRTLAGARARCQSTALGSFPAGGTLPWQPEWTLDALGVALQPALSRQRRLLKALDEQVLPIQKTFAAQTDAPPQQYFEQHRSELPATAAARDWVAPLAAWYAGEHLSYRRILMQEAGAIRAIVADFHGRMSAFHRRVQQFNRELKQSLDTGLAFDSITRIEVEVISTLRELAYWPAIEALVEAPQARAGDGAVELPPPEFASTIGQLLEHWEVRSGIRAELRELIRIQGEVEENGQRRAFRRAADLEKVSSNGLSYLVLCSIFVAFINRIRRQAPVDVVWALDELKDLDAGNVARLLELLARNRITLVSAFPDPDVETLRLFRHRFGIEPDRRLAEVRILDAAPLPAPEAGPAVAAAADVEPEPEPEAEAEAEAAVPAGDRADV